MSHSPSTKSPPQPGRVRAWIMAARLKTLPAAVAPVITGAAIAAADNVFALWPALAALLGALLLQIGSNIANDYFDFLKGADQPDRVGPTRVTATGLLSLRAIRLGMIVVFALAALLGVYLVWIGGWPIVIIGISAILAAVLYTGGPKPFGYLGLGELFVFIFFGPVAVIGTYFVQAHAAPLHVWLASLPLGALITNILVVNNLRDIDTDRRAGKLTLAVRWGREGARREYAIMLGVAYAMPFVLWLVNANPGGNLWLFTPLLTLPRALRLQTTINHATDGPTLNAALAGTARHVLLYALALSIGFLA